MVAWWNRAQQICLAVLKGDCCRAERGFPGCRIRRRRGNYLDGESDMHTCLPHADLPNHWHIVLFRHLKAARDCSCNYYLPMQRVKEQ